MTALVTACGSSGHPAASGTTTAQRTCDQVSAVLANGPDSGADPLGYAEAQVLPLRQIRSSDQALTQAIGTLADAYSGYYAANGTGSAATSALSAAIKRINSLCPEAGATT